MIAHAVIPLIALEAQEQGRWHLAPGHGQHRDARTKLGGQLGLQGSDLLGLQAVGPADQHQVGGLKLVIEQLFNGAEVIKAGIGQALGLDRGGIAHHVALG